ncbi:MAG: sulfatase [Lentisphaeria bacterium]|nr:sulfatase [Lentisphaeria bacterium]
MKHRSSSLNLFKLIGLFIFNLAVYGNPNPPNFVVFYLDDLGWADTSVPMQKDIAESKSDFYQTPSLEKLAANGTVFSRSYSPAPTCTPSRISIQYGMTNAKLQYTTVHDVLASKREIPKKIISEYTAIPEVLKAANKGYVSAHFGKGIEIGWMKDLGYDVTDENDIGPNGNFHGDYTDIKSQTPLAEDNPKNIYGLTDSAVKFIEKTTSEKKPFFMMVSQYSVHVPHAASPKFIEKYRKLPRGKYCTDKDYIDPANMTQGYRTCVWRLQYAAMVEETDISLGRIMDALEKAGVTDNTYIIFTSDNGGGLLPNGALTGGKANLFEGGIRVPMVVSGPKVAKGQYSSVPHSQWDLLPTIHDLIDSTAPLPKEVDGGSLRDIWENGDAGKVDRAAPAIIFNYPYYAAAPVNAMIDGDYKYMKQLNTGEVRLYNVSTDLKEKKNLAALMPEKVSEMAEVLQKYLDQVNAPKLEDVYPARFAELDYFKDLARENYERDLKRELAKAPAEQHAAIEERLKKSLDENIARQDQQIEHCKKQMSNEKFIGGKN